MSYDSQSAKNKQQKYPKVYFEQYLNNTHEPIDNIFSHSPAELDAELLENSFNMKRRFRHIANRLRNRY